MYELFDEEEEEDEELVPRVKYSVILQKEEYEDDDDEEDPLPYVDIGPGYYFFDEEDARLGSVTPIVLGSFFSR
jgi:hypothetical protein